MTLSYFLIKNANLQSVKSKAGIISKIIKI